MYAPGNGSAQPLTLLAQVLAGGRRGLGPLILAGGLRPAARAALRTACSAATL